MTFAPDLHFPDSRSAISHDIVLVFEGRDLHSFFLTVLDGLHLKDRVEVRNAGGIDQLPAFLRTLTQISGFDRVVSLGVVRDNESNPSGAQQSVHSAFSNAGLAVPPGPRVFSTAMPRTGYLLLPDDASPGMLETLCWQAVVQQNLPLVHCVDDFLTCVTAQRGSPPANPEKSRVYAYIAAQEQPHLLLGQATRAGYFPLSSSVFDDLKAFIRDLVPPSPP